MLDLTKCREALDRAQLPAELRPLIFYAGFTHKKLRAAPTDFRSQAITYKLGAQALVLAADSPNSLPTQCSEDVVRWVETNPNFEFQCDCKKNFQSSALRCAECAKSIVDYKVVPKTK